jgi:2',3'-cyclic-nucleotide 2'-phosphodiesterase (5'-nucleotidase family)
LVILYVADIHARLRPDLDGLGGYARIRSFIDHEKSVAGPKTDVVVVGGGDMTDKGSMPCLLKGDLPCISLLSQLGLDFSVIGNHEIQRPLSEWKSLMGLSHIKWISGNVAPISGPKLWDPLVDYRGTKSGIKLRFLAFTKELDRDAFAPRYKEYRFTQAPRTEAEWKPLIPNDSSYILVHHQPTESDSLMLEGLCKSNLKKPLILLKADEENTKWKQNVQCVQGIEPGPHGKTIGRIVVETDSFVGSRITDIAFVDVDDRIPENPQLKSEINALYAKYAPTADQELGSASGNHSPEEMAQWLADSYRSVTHADVAIVNGGAVKSALSKGPLTREKMRLVFPYGNQLMGLDWSFDAMSKAICKALSRTKSGDADYGSELYISGAKVVNGGKPDCRLESGRHGKLKVVIDDYMFKKSGRWLGEDLSKQNTWRFGVETPIAIEERLKRDSRSL